MIAQSQHTEADTGPRSRELERLCIVTRTVRPVSDLIRFVIGPQGEPVPDLKRKLPGRGVWVTSTQGALGEAIKRNAFARGFKREVRAPADLVSRTEHLLERAVLDALAIAGKAGLVVAGFARVEMALRRGDAVALVHAAEASPQGVRKLDAIVRQSTQNGPIPVVRTLTSAQLDLALGRPNMVHAAVLAGPASGTFLARLRLLERFRSEDRPAAGLGRDELAETIDAYGSGCE